MRRCVFRESNAGEKFRTPYDAILLISLSLLFWFAFPWWLMMSSIFFFFPWTGVFHLCFLLSISSLEKSLFLYPFLILGCLLYFLEAKSSLHILDKSPKSGIWFSNIFSYSMGLSFFLSLSQWFPFIHQRFLIKLKLCISFCCSYFLCHFSEFFAKIRSERYTSILIFLRVLQF